jgi:hypothetical protein
LATTNTSSLAGIWRAWVLALVTLLAGIAFGTLALEIVVDVRRREDDRLTVGDHYVLVQPYFGTADPTIVASVCVTRNMTDDHVGILQHGRQGVMLLVEPLDHVVGLFVSGICILDGRC